MKDTTHKLIIGDSRRMVEISDESIDLVITSPPYPMIQMWDTLFSNISPLVAKALKELDGDAAFEYMHLELDKVWKEIYRVAKNGALVCINIGDATRTINKKFQLYSNHSRIISSFIKIGFDTLPIILWRKQTNAPNKFMGSGMLPAGAYVTLEHEYILIFRKGGKRTFNDAFLKEKRMQSSFFWEERNQWFSDIWDFKGINQKLNSKELRERSAAYPFELAYRLVNMYSLYNDVVLDPFLGTATTSYACLSCGRNSIGIELDESFIPIFFENTNAIKAAANKRLSDRIKEHKAFIAEYAERKGGTKYVNIYHNFPVVTRQESKILLKEVSEIIKENESCVKGKYLPLSNLDDGDKISVIYSQKDSGKQISLFG